MRNSYRMAAFAILVAVLFAHPVLASEQVVVRATAFDAATRTYTFSCAIPPGTTQSRYWTIRADQPGLEASFQTMNATLTYALMQDVMYHVGCQVQNVSNASQNFRGDFHIDRRTGPNTLKPNIVMLASEGRSFTARCDPPANVTHYNLYWNMISDPENIGLPQFNNQNTINYTMPVAKLWDISCGIWDLDRSQFTGWGFPVEFFETGPAYVPTLEGCLPGASCPWVNGTQPIAFASTSPASPVARNPPATVNFNYTLSNPSGLVTSSRWLVNGSVVATGTSAYTLSTNATGAWNVTVIVNASTNTIMNAWLLTVQNASVNLPPLPPQWLEPGLNRTDVDTYDFHIQVHPMQDPENDAHVATDFELWDVPANQRVWSALNKTNILLHIHNADGRFEGNLNNHDRLLYDHDYRLRVRFYANQSQVSPWSEWRVFRTSPQIVFNNSPFLWTARPGYTVDLVASNISLPVNVRLAPDRYGALPEGRRPRLYVTQLYGQIGVVRRDGSYGTYADHLLNYDVFGSLPGSGETGVTGLYVDPSTGNVFASMVYDDPISGFLGKVVKFTTNSTGDGYTSMQTILTNIPVAPSHQVQQLTRGPDGKLYLNTGDDDQAGQSQNVSVLSGKILRFNDDGSIPADNPIPGNYVYARGFRNPFGADWRPGTNELWVTNNGPDEDDGIYKVLPGSVFGWCCNTSAGTWHTWHNTVAPVALAFDNGIAGFPDSAGSFYVATSGSTYAQGPSVDAKRIVQFKFNPDGTKESVTDFVTYSGQGYGDPIGLAFGPEGLYFTDIYGELGFVGVGVTQGNVYLVHPGNQTAGNQTNQSGFTATLGPAPWYPQGRNMIWVCRGFGGSGSYTRDFFFGDGDKQLGVTADNVWHTYAANGTYNASCTVHDLTTHLDASVQTTLVIGTSGGNQTPANATLTVTKVVINDGNGTRTAASFPLFVGNATMNASVTTGVPRSFAPGTYVVTEVADPNYATSYAGACSAAGIVTLTAGANVACTITNNDIGGSPPPPQACSVASVPVTCSGGTITQDAFNGCRTVTCGGLRILACDKPDNAPPQYFEMYRQQEAQGVQICLGTTCISGNGYARSPDYQGCGAPQGDTSPPVVSNGQPTGTLPAGTTGATLQVTTNEPATCKYATVPGTAYAAMAAFSTTGGTSHSKALTGLSDGQSYAYYVKCSDALGNTNSADYAVSFSVANQTGAGATLAIAPWFPQGRSYIFVCDAQGFTPTAYDFTFGNGEKNLDRQAHDVYYTYPAAGSYTVACTARNGASSASATLAITVA